MKSFTFFLLLALMLGGSILIISHKMGVNFGEGEALASLNIGFNRGSVAEPSEWKGLLTGRWEFKTKFADPREIWLFEGEVEYFSNGEFVRQMTVRYYRNSRRVPEIDDEDLGIIAGGTVKGSWKVDTASRFWKETTIECTMKNSFVDNGLNEKYEACEWFASPNDLVYGNSVKSFGSSKVEEFATDEISIVGKDFDSGGKKTWSFKKIKE